MTKAKIALIAFIILILAAGAGVGWWMWSSRSAPVAPTDAVTASPGQSYGGVSGDGSGATPSVSVEPPSTPPTSYADQLKSVPNPERIILQYPDETGPSGRQATLADILKNQEPSPSAPAESGDVVLPDAPASGVSEPAADPDGDGLTNAQEATQGTAPDRADTDEDGLSDGEEVRQRRTDPKRTDTDGDGLRDGEEIARWQTDPLNPDTDGDTYPDGTEVKGGYNPRGTGRL